MSGEMAHLTVECAACGRRLEVGANKVEAKLDGELTAQNIVGLRGAFKCAACGSRFVRLYDAQGRLAFDPHHIKPCAACGEPIPLTRLSAAPEASLCFACQQDNEREPVAPPYPQPAPEMKTCPRCGSLSVVRQNGEDMGWFLGCSAFPKCRWTAPYEPAE